MANFSYTARDKFGSISKGSVFGADRAAAAASLIEKGFTPILLKEEGLAAAGGKGFKLALPGLGNKIKLTDKVIFSRQFATMINAGVPIVQSLSILKEQTSSKAFKTVLGDLAKKVQGGTTLSNAMAVHPHAFSPVYINMVRAGESGGILDEVLERLATQQEKDAAIVSKVRGAMIYPSVIVTVTVGAFVFLMTGIVPKMAEVFEQFGTELPAYTRAMLATSKFMTQNGILLLGITIGSVIAISRWRKTKAGRKAIDNLILRAPIFGPIVRKVNVARFARTFGSLMTSGISVLDALRTTGMALGNSVYQDDVLKLATAVQNGKTISEPLRNNSNFPPIVGQMITVGEETGKLDEILIKVATFYENEVDAVISNITSIIEPIMIVVIGGMIGSIVISVLGPLGNLSNAI